MRKGTERFLKISKIVLDNQDGLRYDIRVAAEKQRRGRPARQASETVNPFGIHCYHHNRIYDNLKEMQP